MSRQQITLRATGTGPAFLNFAVTNPLPGRPACVGQWKLFHSDDKAERDQAIRICDTCPIATARACRTAAIDRRERHGVWGGRDFTAGMIPKGKKCVICDGATPTKECRYCDDCRPIGGVRGGVAPEDVDHGTEKGFNWHNWRKEPPCPPCRAAGSAATRERRRRRLAARTG